MTFDEWWKTTYRKQGRVAAEQSWQASRKAALEEAIAACDLMVLTKKEGWNAGKPFMAIPAIEDVRARLARLIEGNEK